MRYTRIDLAGKTNIFATLSRKTGSAAIDIEIIEPTGTTRLAVPAEDEEARWSMAKRLQQALDGFRGSGGDIRDYSRALELFAD